MALWLVAGAYTGCREKVEREYPLVPRPDACRRQVSPPAVHVEGRLARHGARATRTGRNVTVTANRGIRPFPLIVGGAVNVAGLNVLQRYPNARGIGPQLDQCPWVLLLYPRSECNAALIVNTAWPVWVIAAVEDGALLAYVRVEVVIVVQSRVVGQDCAPHGHGHALAAGRVAKAKVGVLKRTLLRTTSG